MAQTDPQAAAAAAATPTTTPAMPAMPTMPTDDAAIAALTALLGGRDAVSILDLGGGTGVYAVPLARLGHRVDVLDQSPDALATLRRRAQSAGVDHLVHGQVADLDALDGPLAGRRDDVVLCHRVLEYVEDPLATLRAAAALLAPGGWMSVIAANRDGAVLSRIVSGRLGEAARIAAGDDAQGKSGRRFEIGQLEGLMAAAELQIDSARGLGLASELSPAEASTAEIKAVHEATCRRPALRDVSPFVHLIVRPAP
ncbi:methyltransferase domain-containing protein [Epidermidibacterium keratini]|uniref:Methyltransferase domain-containing protein n=1 Tax=Epidermidibacterium keratini TaxID=1891644 RepID=A0A7L4YJT3_9ACTN|nr:class I SAM-dependent methyltransferase [Epidermidibacterium keratini]QHB99152.1 methyltransferase domain-containing protein [Epidermidibacterium keratini]